VALTVDGLKSFFIFFNSFAMKKNTPLIICLLLFSFSVTRASNYYWVGGTGTWSDFASHWATSSGGTVFHVTIPSPGDDVFFDGNSFPTIGDTVYIDTTITNCKTMDWSGALNSPVMFSPLFNDVNLNIYGSMILNPSMTWLLSGAINLRSTAQSNILNTAGISLTYQTGGLYLIFADTAVWDLVSPLTLQGNASSVINIQKGTLRTNGYPITCDQFELGLATLFLDTSTISCFSWSVIFAASQLDADSAVFHCQHFSGGGNKTYFNVFTNDLDANSCSFNDVQCNYSLNADTSTFHNVTMSSQLNNFNGNSNVFNKCIMPGSSCNISGNNNQCDTLIFNNPGQVINISNNVTVNVNSLLIIQSDPGFPTSITCTSGTGIISKPTDTVCTDFIYLKNINATGGAVYFAGDHSVDLGGNTGWNWMRCAPLISNVWPGDCNYDLVTDNFDLLNIGVSFGDTGYVRPAASLSYTAQPCQDWYYQFINGVNVKHADCDGNGIVDANDSTAISLNYGLTHPARLTHGDETNGTGAELAFVLPAVISPGASVSVPINLGTSFDPADNVYGIAFSVNYDPLFIQPGTMSVTYSSSWVENSANHLHLEKDFPGSGRTDIAFTRIDHSDITGYGMIATLNFIASPTADGPFDLSFSHILVISHNQIEVPVHTTSSSTWVNIEEGNEIVSAVYPNPMTTQAHLVFSNPNHDSWHLELKDVTGRTVSNDLYTSGNSFLIEKKNFGSGVYFYQLRNSAGKTGNGKIVIE
jgi:hypothetical protein